MATVSDVMAIGSDVMAIGSDVMAIGSDVITASHKTSGVPLPFPQAAL